jgi:hypothetical protein
MIQRERWRGVRGAVGSKDETQFLSVLVKVRGNFSPGMKNGQLGVQLWLRLGLGLGLGL